MHLPDPLFSDAPTASTALEVDNLADSNNSSNTGRWTSKEHAQFLDALKLHGQDWRKIALDIKSRNNVQVRTHAQKYFKKLERMKRKQANNGKKKPALKRPGRSASKLTDPIEGENDSTESDTDEGDIVRSDARGPVSMHAFPSVGHSNFFAFPPAQEGHVPGMAIPPMIPSGLLGPQSAFPPTQFPLSSVGPLGQMYGPAPAGQKAGPFFPMSISLPQLGNGFQPMQGSPGAPWASMSASQFNVMHGSATLASFPLLSGPLPQVMPNISGLQRSMMLPTMQPNKV